MTEQEVIQALNEIKEGSDQEQAHGEADELILKFAPPAVRDAYEAACLRVGGFWYA